MGHLRCMLEFSVIFISSDIRSTETGFIQMKSYSSDRIGTVYEPIGTFGVVSYNTSNILKHLFPVIVRGFLSKPWPYGLHLSFFCRIRHRTVLSTPGCFQHNSVCHVHLLSIPRGLHDASCPTFFMLPSTRMIVCTDKKCYSNGFAGNSKRHISC